MKRLMKKAGDYTYVLESGIKIMIIGDDLLDEYMLDPADEYCNDLIRAVRDEMIEMGSKGLAEYIDYDYINLEPDIIKSIIVEIVENKANAVVKATRELTNEELNKIKDYIIGQYSDGWGEGFEQYPITDFEEECEDWDEDEQETYSYTEKYEVSASFYDRKIKYTWK